MGSFILLLAQEVISYCLVGETSFPVLFLWLCKWIFQKGVSAIEFRTSTESAFYELDDLNPICSFLPVPLSLNISCIFGKRIQDKCWSESSCSFNIMDHNHFLLHLTSATFYVKIHMFFRDGRKTQSCLKENGPTSFNSVSFLREYSSSYIIENLMKLSSI